ncbi:hypothetical protein GF389_01510 [Candidatus Dojkabacteria bacterium]|nr:hypothetical protein [Candidatus Dojkabacteria bacterium]
MQKKSIKVKFKGHSVEIPYIVFRGKGDGPKVFLSGGIHGDEVNGPEVMRRTIEYFEKEKIEDKLNGTIYLFPLLNCSGFDHMSRGVYEDGRDLNRAFGVAKSKIKSFSEQIAYELTEQLLKKCDFGIDVHDSGGNAVLLPHVRVHKFKDPKGVDCPTCSRELGQIFGTKVLLEREGQSGMLAVEMKREFNIEVLTVEIGGGQEFYINSLPEGLQGILNVLKYKKMIPGEPSVQKEQFILHERYGVKAKDSALLQLKIELGQRVDVGEEVGWLYYPKTQKKELLVSPVCGILFSKWMYNQISKDSYIFTVLDVEECNLQEGKTRHLELLKTLKVERIQQ